jgi:Xaa-Pro aminopeptidase
MIFESERSNIIRVEDDVLVTPGGHRVLTSKVPKGIEEIERLMAR